ncbi:hypothetical protein FRX31_005251 [Thalictrum thalictroides]|uniref:Uncharacterized protein n=1 Tax=Thalictrum thalictroides TaxID=46969 RepID=A0A7J6X9S1_THATH|nr:hypothetical protein FRX31_005251 [Thalictrum thalictroides]
MEEIDNNNTKGNANIEHTFDLSNPDQAGIMNDSPRLDIIGDGVEDAGRDDKHGLGQFHIDTLNRTYVLHSPTKKDDCGDKLIMLLKRKKFQVDREHIQSGFLPPQWKQRLEY